MFFEESRLAHYSNTQSAILNNVSRALTSGSFLVYMTCSLFAMENEDVILPFAQSGEYHLIVQELIYGYEHDSDSLFIAVLRKN